MNYALNRPAFDAGFMFATSPTGTPGVERSTQAGVTVNALHPGAVVTDIWDNTPGLMRPLTAAVKQVVMLPPVECGARITHLAIDPGVSDITGAYFDRNRVKAPSILARDAALAQRLRGASDQLTGIDRKTPSDPTTSPATLRRVE